MEASKDRTSSRSCDTSNWNEPRLRALFATTPLGLRIIITILDRMVSLHDVEELSDGGQAFEIG